MGCNVHDIQNKDVVYDTKNKNLMINFQDETQNLVKSTLWKIHIYWAFIQQWLTQNMWSIGATICIFNNKLQNISLKNSFIWKSEKD